MPLFRKRELHIAMSDSSTKSSFTIPISAKNKQYISSLGPAISVAKGIKIQSFTSVGLCADVLRVDEKNVRGWQDFVAWFVNDGSGGTVLTIVTKVDLGADIPRYANQQYVDTVFCSKLAVQML